MQTKLAKCLLNLLNDSNNPLSNSHDIGKWPIHLHSPIYSFGKYSLKHVKTVLPNLIKHCKMIVGELLMLYGQLIANWYCNFINLPNLLVRGAVNKFVERTICRYIRKINSGSLFSTILPDLNALFRFLMEASISWIMEVFILLSKAFFCGVLTTFVNRILDT